MRIAVLGAGVIGVTSAWQLLKDGHQVTVIDREAEPASFTSYANAGLVAPAHAYAWASPAAPKIMMRSLWNSDQAIRLKPRMDPRQWQWMWLFYKECTAERARINTINKARLATYSQKVLGEVAAETGIQYDRNQGGVMYWYRSPLTLMAAESKSKLLQSMGLEVVRLTPEEVIKKDPGLAPARDQIAGGLFTPSDESGDCRHFTRGLAKLCEKKGAAFKMQTEVTGLEAKGDQITRVRTSKGDVEADAYVVCAGLYSPHMTKSLGLKLPIYPVKGYSMTVPITDRSLAPRIGGVDEDYLLAYCPMGDRLRITATAEIAGYDNSHTPEDFRVMVDRARKLFPKGIDFSKPDYWAGLRPMLPKGMPVIDRSPYTNLWLNTGHGHIGWTMSNGSARVLADLVGQRKPAIDREGMHYEP